MAVESSTQSQKINLRRPEIMAAVQAQVVSHYRSELVERIRAQGNVLRRPALQSSWQRNLASVMGSNAPLIWHTPPANHFRQKNPSTCSARLFTIRKSTTKSGTWELLQSTAAQHLKN